MALGILLMDRINRLINGIHRLINGIHRLTNGMDHVIHAINWTYEKNKKKLYEPTCNKPDLREKRKIPTRGIVDLNLFRDVGSN